MIYCCGHYFEPFRTVFVMPDFKYRDRKLEIGNCPKCGALIAVLTQYNVKDRKYETYRPARKKTASFIREVEAGKWQEISVKYGTKGRAGFCYGKNIEMNDGSIRQYSVDFNGTSRLVKVVNINCSEI